MSDTQIETQAPSPDAIQKEALKAVRDELRVLLSRRRNFRIKLIQFQRRHRNLASKLPDLAKEE
jgi:hypothetical protein